MTTATTIEHASLIIALATIFSGICIIGIKALLKSDCKKLQCCCLECERDSAEDPGDLDITP